ncbi:hypothetical protein HELRODRAFT_175642 [Helobdella robusta]|uniref:Protein kinase domain-containing protein n=1 Tax=Helobdella robusta TaxID=6412 RepID=T1F9G5_HELRO|nr:hypothetical protein HELRODRAFT_175642 [Helobdella robusta]ESO00661.1 hypothetical protein HELRODRAFT_175642 [Helobdella robusta]
MGIVPPHQQHPPMQLVVVMVSAVVILVTAVVLVAFFFNKCSRVHTKLLKKTLLAKKNSYKSAPGVTITYTKEDSLQHQSSSGAAHHDEWELDAREVTLGVEIGQGAFGLVMTGYYRSQQVAIKVIKGDVLPSYKEELLREIQLMKTIGRHNNIVSIVGACTLKDPIALIMEYMPFGNLQSFLQKCRLEGEMRRTNHGVEMDYCPLDHLTGTKESWSISATDLLSFARQISVAMEFISDKKYVHRDVAARNVLVSSNKIVKLCDFGLARIVQNGDQYCKLTNGRLPLKWMALESIRDRIFTTQSDVWSYGVLLWEITTLGSTPYPDIALIDLYRLLCDGFRMKKPANCSCELYNLMRECWLESPDKRPTFNEIKLRLEGLLAQKGNYLDLELIDSSLNRLKRPPTPVQPIEFRHSPTTYLNKRPLTWNSDDSSGKSLKYKNDVNDDDDDDDCNVVWKTSGSNDYQEPRKVFKSSIMTSSSRKGSGSYHMTTTTVVDSDLEDVVADDDNAANVADDDDDEDEDDRDDEVFDQLV